MATSNTNEWYVYPAHTIDQKTCKKLKDLGKNKWGPSSVDISTDTTDEERRTGIKQKLGIDKKIRISDIVWCNDQWIYDLIWPFMMTANHGGGWRYNIKAAESCQITRYKKRGFYNFHIDGRGDHISAYDNPENPLHHGQVRKLSMSLMLNDNFEGGAFEFASYSKGECTVTPFEAKAGSIIVFPSSMEHRVAPITKGTRYSLVCWFVGPPFV